MELRTVERDPGSFQDSVSAEQMTIMARRAFGTGAELGSVVQISGGRYNNTYRSAFADGRQAILRVAPEPQKQFRIERALMRNEHFALPFFSPIAAMMPKTLFSDWTHEVIGRDYLWQTVLDGVAAAGGGLAAYPRSLWSVFYGQLGTLSRRVHAVRGDRFGPIAGPTFATWSEAVLSVLDNTAADLVDAGLDAADVRVAIDIISREQAVLDEIREPRLLHGDLWTPNVMLAPEAPEPTITGVLDHDRASWGDPAADWAIHLAGRLSGRERDTFWETYGRPADDPAVAWRSLVYRVVHLGASRLERQRLGKRDKIPSSYQEMRAVLDLLAAEG